MIYDIYIYDIYSYSSATADSHIKLLDRVVRSVSIIASGVFECNLVHPGSVTVLCMLFKIKSNPMHPLRSAFPMPYVPAMLVCNMHGALVAHSNSLAPPRRRTSQCHRTVVASLYLYGTILMTLFLMVWDWWIFRAEPMSF